MQHHQGKLSSLQMQNSFFYLQSVFQVSKQPEVMLCYSQMPLWIRLYSLLSFVWPYSLPMAIFVCVKALLLMQGPTSVVSVKRDTDRKLDFFCSPDGLAYGCSLCPHHTVLSITFSLTAQQHKAIRAATQMNVIHTQRCSELQSSVPLCHFLWDTASTSKHFFLKAGAWEAALMLY